MKVWNYVAQNIAILLIASFGVAASSDLCNEAVTTNTKLESDLECSCRGRQHLVDVQEGAILDLNGYSVKCTGNTRAKSCIHLDGFAATVVNGAVQNCKIGVHLDGTGSHRVVGVTVTESDKGMYIQKNSDHNQVIANSIVSEGIGIQVIGDHSEVRQNSVVSEGDDGIEMDNDARNARIVHNKVLSAKKACIRVHGDDCEVEGNILTNCEEDGIFFRRDSSNVLVSYNKIAESGGNGIYIEGGRVFVSGNTVTDSGSDGIQVRRSADDPHISDNFISYSGEDGISLVDGDFSSAIEGNTVTTSSGENGISVKGKPPKIVRDNLIFNCSGGNGRGIKLENEALASVENIVSRCA